MRGYLDPQASMFSYFSPEARVPAAHPLRSIKGYADTALKSLSRDFNELYASTGRPSIPPERLLKASLLIALYSVRSDRLFCEMLDYNILFRWFLDMSLEERGLDQSNFSRLRERLLESKVAGRFFDAVVGETRKLDLLSDEHFTVDGTLIEAWASTAKSLRRKDGPPDAAGPDDQGMVNIRGERRSNATHTSATDPDPKLMRKGKGKESKLSYGGQRSGRIATVCAWTSRSLRLWTPRPEPPRPCWTGNAASESGPVRWAPTRAITARISWRICVGARSPRTSR